MGPVDVASKAGVYEYTRTFAGTVFDYDKDGRDDYFFPLHDPQAPQRGESIPAAHLYHSAGSTFSDVGFPGRTDRHGCIAGELSPNDGLGLPDLFCAVGLTQNSVNELWIQNANHTFTNRASIRGLTLNTHGRYRTAALIKVNNDAIPDIYVTRYYGDNGDPLNPGPAEATPWPNELWLSQPDGTFKRDTSYGLSVPIGAQKDNDACNQAVDFNSDGRQDLLVCAYKAMYLYRNDGDHFTGVAASLGIGGFWSDAELVDLNLDGRLDLVQAHGNLVRIKLREATGAFVKVFEATMKSALNLATGDFDGNGTIDIYVVGSCEISPTTAYPPDQPDLLIYNDGGGRFRAQSLAAIPAESGCGDDVDAMDRNGDGLTEFMVLNGRRHEPGPVQLFTYAPISQDVDTTPPSLRGPMVSLGNGRGIDTAGNVPVDVSWLGYDASGIARWDLELSRDGGASFSRVTLPSPTARQAVLWLQPGTNAYQFRVRATDSAGNTSGWTLGPVSRIQVEDEVSPNITYSGTWTGGAAAGAWGGNLKRSAIAGSKAVLRVPVGSRSVTWLVPKGADQGIAEVWLDGGKIATVDLYSASSMPRRLLLVRNPNPLTAHTLEIRVLGTKNSSSSAAIVSVDGAVSLRS
jgi:hypothetical protein